jgi:hypothetical protein
MDLGLHIAVDARKKSFLRHTAEKASTLLVGTKLRKEYEALHVEIDKAKGIFIKALKERSKSKKGLEKEISTTFTKSESEFSGR